MKTKYFKTAGLLCMLLLLLAAALCCRPNTAQAATVEDLSFTLSADGQSYAVTACKTSATGALEIPATYNGLPVTTIRNYAFESCYRLTSVTIPNSVTTIGDYAFSKCSDLIAVTIPDSVTTIGDDAFYNCRSLTSVTIHNSVTSIGSYAFEGCSSLNAVHITDLAAWCRISFDGSGANPLCNAENLYINGVLVTDITIPESITAIGVGAFQGCDSLTSVTIPDSVTTIGNHAFHGCSSLTSVTIPDSVTTIGNYAFSSCYRLTSVTIGDSVTTIGNHAFYECSRLTSVTIPDSVTTIGSGAFRSCSRLTSVTIPDSVTTIGDDTFEHCSSLTSVTIPNSVTTIGSWAFSSCSKLTSVTIGDSVITIGSGAFRYCDSLTDLYVVDANAWCRIQFADSYANPYAEYVHILDANGEEVTEVTLDESVIAIPTRAFYNCKSLLSVTIPDSVTAIGSHAFSGCDWLMELSIGSGVTTIWSGAFEYCHSLTSVTIPNSVTLIGIGAFFSCSSLTSVTIGDSVTTIGERAFQGCSSLTSVTIPNSVTTIGECVFEGCDSLTMATIGAENVGESAFYNCNKLTSVTFTPNVKRIHQNAFQGCKLSAVDFLGDAPLINANAFRGQTATVTYPATNATWTAAKQQNYGGTLTWLAKDSAITAQPQSILAEQGKSVIFSVTAAGTDLSYRWQYSKDGGKTWLNSTSATSGYNTAAITLAATAARNGFMYRCVITDYYGTVLTSDSATLTIDMATLNITFQPQDVIVKQGGHGVFTVAAEGENLTYRWQYSTNGKAWYSTSSFTKGYNTPNLSVLAEEKRDGFRYRCKITDADGNVFYSDAAMLDVDVPALPAFVEQPKDQHIIAGNAALFQVQLQGDIASIQWQYQTAPGTAWYNSTTSGYNTDTLTITATAARNGFMYRCVVTDRQGYVHTSKEVSLSVVLAQIVCQSQDQTVAKGGQAVFFVGVTGQMQSCYWQYSRDGGKSWYASSSNFVGYNSTAMLVEATAARNGFLYRCVVIDADGNRIESEAAMLTVK